VFKFLKSAFGSKAGPLPEEEMPVVFTKLMAAKPEVIQALHYRVNQLYDSLGISGRLEKLLITRLRNPGSVDGEAELEFIKKLFEMERAFEEKGMNIESVATKLIALDYACHALTSGDITAGHNRKRCNLIFQEFQETGVINLSPRRRHIPPMD